MKTQKQRAAGGEVNETPPPPRSNVQLPAENQTRLGTFIGEPFPGSQQNSNDIMEMKRQIQALSELVQTLMAKLSTMQQ